MHVVIIGAGEVGYHVVGTLYREGVEIVGVDHDQMVLDHLRQEFGIETFQGNAMDPAILERAGVGACDLFLAITDSDETNIISCLTVIQCFSKHFNTGNNSFEYFTKTNNFNFFTNLNFSSLYLTGCYCTTPWDRKY